MVSGITQGKEKEEEGDFRKENVVLKTVSPCGGKQLCAETEKIGYM